jgi:hypothetical protein
MTMHPVFAHAYLTVLCADAAPARLKKKRLPSHMRKWKQQQLQVSR